MAAVAALEGQTGMLQLEITRGQIGPKDLEKVIAKLKAMCGTLYGVTSFAVSRPFSSFSFPTTLTFFPAVGHHTRTKWEGKRLARKSHASSYCRSPKTLATPGRTQPSFPLARRPCPHSQRIVRRPSPSVYQSTQRYQSMAHAREPYPMEKSTGRCSSPVSERRKSGKRQTGIGSV